MFFGNAPCVNLHTYLTYVYFIQSGNAIFSVKTYESKTFRN